MKHSYVNKIIKSFISINISLSSYYLTYLILLLIGTPQMEQMSIHNIRESTFWKLWHNVITIDMAHYITKWSIIGSFLCFMLISSIRIISSINNKINRKMTGDLDSYIT